MIPILKYLLGIDEESIQIEWVNIEDVPTEQIEYILKRRKIEIGHKKRNIEVYNFSYKCHEIIIL